MEGSPLPLGLVSIQLFITKICYMDLSDWPQKGHAVGSGWPLLANLGMCSTYWVAGKTNLRDQFFGCTYKDRVCVRVFIGVSIHTCMRIYVCSMFLKKNEFHLHKVQNTSSVHLSLRKERSRLMKHVPFSAGCLCVSAPWSNKTSRK
jgi:hypothetical protein